MTENLRQALQYQKEGRPKEAVQYFTREIRSQNHPDLYMMRIRANEAVHQDLKQELSKKPTDARLQKEITEVVETMINDSNRLIQLEPWNPSWLCLAGLFHKDFLKDLEKAEQLFIQANQIKYSASAWSGLAEIKAQKRQFEDAIKCYNMAIQDESLPHVAKSTLHIQKAHIFQAMHKLDEALQSAADSIACGPNPQAYESQGAFYMAKALKSRNPKERNELMRKSIESFNWIIKYLDTIKNRQIPPARTAKAYTDRGYVYLNLGDLDQALKDFDEAARHAHSPMLSANRAATFRAMNKPELAVIELTDALKYQAPNEFKAGLYRERADLYYNQLKRTPEALEDLSKSIELSPNHEGSLGLRYNILAESERWAESLQDADKLVSVAPSWSSYLSRALANHHTQKRTAAIADFQKALSLNRQASLEHFPIADGLVGTLLTMETRFTEALPELTSAIDRFPENTEYLLNRARCYYNTREMEKALKDCDRYVEEEPTKTDGYFLRACVYYTIGQFDAGEADLNTALAFEPENPSLLQLRERLTATKKQVQAEGDKQ